MPQIIPIKDLKNTANISKICAENKEPIFITKNGYGDMVIMSIKTYEHTMAQTKEAELVNEAIKDIENDKNIIDGKIVFERLKAKYEL